MKCKDEILEDLAVKSNSIFKGHVNITFLDLNVSFSGNKLTADLYIKSADKHQYLDYTSGHPAHTKRSNIYS